MVKPTIMIAHKLKGRVRFKLSLPFKRPKEAGEFLTEYEGIDSFEYNGITKSVLVKFDSLRVDLNEIIMRLSIIYSKQYGMMPINVYIAKSNKNSSLAYFAITNIVIAAFIKNFTPLRSKEIMNFLSWSAVGTTSLAILDHGYNEIKEQGAFDPELVSSVYLFNAVKNGKLLTGSFITWLAAFGRHSLDLPYEGITVKVKELENIFTGQPQYNISIYRGVRVEEENIDGKIGLIRDLINNYIDNKQFKLQKNYFMGNNSMLDSKEVGASELLGSSNNIVINNRSESFSI
ncbi:MAG: hypothetical protein ACTHW2_03965 [Tissierella sp.]|uniref:hypothetical protein n=1 Tax=Tissierella sp. TaxID=41274 RepID=UPI003F9CD09A